MPDALVAVLNRAGYLPVFLPRSGLTPPDVMLYFRKERRLVRYGALADLVPEVKKISPTSSNVARIEGHNKTEKSFTSSLGFLQGALRAMGIESAPKLDLGFSGNSNLIFSFIGVSGKEIDLLKLNDVLETVKLDGLPEDSVAEGGAHLAYGYLYARQLEVRRSDGKNFDFGVNGKVDSFIDLAQKGKVTDERGVAILFEATGDDLPAFAYKAARLVPHENGGFVALGERTRLSERRETTDEPYLPQRGVAFEVSNYSET